MSHSNSPDSSVGTPDTQAIGPTRCAVLVPIKPPAIGKSRLRSVGSELRQALAAAFALDTITAARQAALVVGVLAITDDYVFADQLRREGAVVIPDGVSDDLNGTLTQGAFEAVRRWPGSVPVALAADLPALRPHELDEALRQAATQRAAGPWFVSDHHGTGTTCYLAELDDFAPRFGPDSARAHRDVGARPLNAELVSLRQDVDDFDDLARALGLGVGSHTARVVAMQTDI